MRAWPRLALAATAFLITAAPSSVLHAQECLVEPFGVTAWWSGDCSGADTRGTAEGYLRGGASIGTGWVQSGFVLDGIDDHVYIADTPSLDFGSATDLTIEAWVRTTRSGVYQNIVEKRGESGTIGYLVSLTPTGAVNVFLSDGQDQFAKTSSVSGLGDGSFHHVVLVVDRDMGATIYVDGVPSGAGAIATIGDISNSGAFVIGRGNVNAPGSVHGPFAGAIDEVRVYRRALGESEIEQIHAAGTAGVCRFDSLTPPLVASGYEVDLVVDTDDPCRTFFHVTSGADGALYVGGTGHEDAVAATSVLRIDRRTTSSTPYGPSIPDPDGVVVDRIGSVATTGPGTVLVGSAETIVQIDPVDRSASTRFTFPGANIQQMVFDPSGRLYAASAPTDPADGRVLVSDGAALTSFATLNSAIGGVAVDPISGRVYASAYLQGTIKVLTMDGTVLDEDFVPGLITPDALAFDASGTFGADLIVLDRAQGVLRVDPATGAREPVASGFAEALGLCFGEDGALYVSEARAIWKIVPKSGSVVGRVTTSCPAPNTPLHGVTVDVFDAVSGELVDAAVTAADGTYAFPELLAGNYTITVVTPLGQTIEQGDITVEIGGGREAQVDFALACAEAVGERRGSGFWKHEFGVATGGHGRAQLSPSALCDLLDLIEARFNDNAMNEVVVYEPPLSGSCPDALEVAASLLNLQGRQETIARARQKFLSVLLNIAIGSIVLHAPASTDGATTSQAITYLDQLLDDPAGDHALAMAIADVLIRGDLVAGGVIPLDTVQIAYRRAPDIERQRFGILSALPNPFNPRTAIEYALDAPGRVEIRIHDTSGRSVRTIQLGDRPAGLDRVHWDGTDDGGAAVASGVYHVRLLAAGRSDVLRIVLLK